MSDSWTNADDAELAHYALPDEHPSRVVAELIKGLRTTPIPTERLDELLAVPGSWGNFSAAAGFVPGLALGNRTLRDDRYPEIVYVNLVEDQGSQVLKRAAPPKARVTLVWMDTAWKLLALGGSVPPAEAGPFTHGSAPIYDTDVRIEWPEPS